jgi:hypothetical protein
MAGGARSQMKGGGAVRCAMCRKRRRGSGTHDAKETGGRPRSRVPHEGEGVPTARPSSTGHPWPGPKHRIIF